MRKVLVFCLIVSAAGAVAGPMAPATELDQLTRHLASADASTRRGAAKKLKECAAACSAAVPALVTMMQRSEPEDVAEAAYALYQILGAVKGLAARLGQSAPPAAFEEGCRAVRPTARRKLNEAVPATTAEAQFAETGTVTLSGLCAEAEDVSTLARIVSSPAFSANTRMVAITTLSEMGPAAAGAIPALRAVIGNASDSYADILIPRAQAALDSIPAVQAHVEKAGPTPGRGTVTGSLILDGKAIVVHSAMAVGFTNPFSKVKGLRVALSAAPVALDPRPANTATERAERLDHAVTEGITIDMEVDPRRCGILVVRAPSLGERRLVKTSDVCAAAAITIDSDRVEGTVTSSPDGKEEIISGHKVSYTLHFNAPIMK
jgi:hypothetical protein